MTASIAEQTTEGRGSQPVARPERPNRKPGTSEAVAAVTPRYFLSKAEVNGNGPALDREMATEAEAMLESLKTGRSYYSVVEWRAVADCAGKTPQVKKESVTTARRNGG